MLKLQCLKYIHCFPKRNNGYRAAFPQSVCAVHFLSAYSVVAQYQNMMFLTFTAKLFFDLTGRRPIIALGSG